MLSDFKLLVQDFRKVAGLAGINIPENALTIESLPAPHKPPSKLPKEKIAVYIFVWNGQCLKVGKAGRKTQARYASQHYNPFSSNSNLAKSICSANVELGLVDISESNVGAWIKSNTDRTNILLDVEYGMPVLNLLEAFLQCRLKPRFEGFDSQR